MEAPAQDIPYTTAHGGAYFNNAGAAVVDPQSVQAAHAAAQEAVGRARAQAAAVQQQQQLAVARSASCGSLANTGMSRNDSAADLLSAPQQLVAPAMPGVGSAAPTQTPMLANDGALHRNLLDLLPGPVFVRSGNGDILYANRALTNSCGVSVGMVPAPWQIAPHASVPVGTVVAEPDLPPDMPGDANGGVPNTPLPPAALNCPVQLTDGQGNATNILPMHRIPFWLATEDGTGNHRAVVLYVQVRPPPAAQFFPAMVSSSRAASGAC